MLKVNNIEVVYNKVILVLKGISLEVPEGMWWRLLGANGAGKSTTLKAITGILETQNGELKEGTIEFMGKPIQTLDPDRIVKLGITMVPEGRKVFQDLTVKENLMIGAHTPSDRKRIKQDIEKDLRLFSGLGRAKEPLGRIPFRWGAADAGHRPGFDVQTQIDDAG